MKEEISSIAKIEDDVRSEGKAFLGLRLSDMLLRIAELKHSKSKRELIQEYFMHQVGTHDTDIGGTRTRVNSAIRIIKAKKVLYVLELIVESDYRVLPEAVETKNTITKIKNGKNNSSYTSIYRLE